MKLITLEDLLHHELKDLYSAEKQLVEALPKMARAASNIELRHGFEAHLEETRLHVKRLEQIGEFMGKSLGRHRCKVMEALIEESAELMREEGSVAIKDASLIGAAQRVEHYEIAAYGAAGALAGRLGLQDVARLLQATLDEEKNADARLTLLAEATINEIAVDDADDDE